MYGPKKKDSLTPSKAYVDTSVLTDILLKKNPIGDAARESLKRYAETILPVYAIKEFKAGPLQYYIYLHNKLLTTNSVAQTLSALTVIMQSQPNRARTASAALADFIGAYGKISLTDMEAADLYRSATKRAIMSAWRKRRTSTTRVSDELTCYLESDPEISLRTGMFENPATSCKLYGSQECCLASNLKGRAKDLSALLEAIKGKEKKEDNRRRAVLRKMLNTPKRPMDPNDCRKLGDAFFALFAPSDAVILTTNIKDHEPLALALGKTVATP